MKLLPINNHLLIELVEFEEFIASEKTSYEEIGVVKAVADNITDIPLGAKIYFEGFMAKKYPPLTQGEPDVWLINRDEVAGIVV